jgi:hypothetical protein
MDSPQALSHITPFASKPLVSIPPTAQHPKAELAALLALLPPDATASDVAVLAVLWCHTGADGQAWPGQKRIADRARVSVRTVRNASQRMERAGVIGRRVPALATRPARKTTRYALPTPTPGPRAVKPADIPTPARDLAQRQPLPSVVDLPTPLTQGQPLPSAEGRTAQEPQQPPRLEQPAQRQPLPVNHRQPLPPKSSNKINQSQSARVNVLPVASALADRFRAPGPASPAAAPPTPRRLPPPATAALRSAPDTAPALGVLRAWKAQLSLPLAVNPKAPEPAEQTRQGGDTDRNPSSEPRGS